MIGINIMKLWFKPYLLGFISGIDLYMILYRVSNYGDIDWVCILLAISIILWLLDAKITYEEKWKKERDYWRNNAL
jgi:hypothetical protein